MISIQFNFMLELTNLPRNFTSEDIREYLEDYGTVHDVVLCKKGTATAKVSEVTGQSCL